MSDKFDGFSQDEIKKFSGATKGRRPQPVETMKQAFRAHSGIRRMPENRVQSTENLKKQPTKKSSESQPGSLPGTTTRVTRDADAPKNPSNGDMEKDEALDEVNLNRSMSKSIEEALFYLPVKRSSEPSTEPTKTNKLDEKLNGVTNSNNADDSSILKVQVAGPDVTSTTDDTINESSILPQNPSARPQSQANRPQSTTTVANADSPFKGISLKDFETHRKMIEEQNKQKKELLYKAIEHHSQKTAAEARKIAEIKNELAKLDNDLALDVSILRKQIDNACMHYAHIEKQYMKIEAQFLKAKIDLHNAAEKKELLTEHLCTVIAHNEDRKAQKLSELMDKVGLTETGELNEPVSSNNVDK